jgi:hypothetical protein
MQNYHDDKKNKLKEDIYQIKLIIKFFVYN